ncbi:hypothetical protein OIE66_06020 [Nonomuraea sp. NBC_01738]|uniref:hypothetical protein n=1 Tax=Nonomuraea sp. NBC_01738 TaxID=2976003 RepID=UPI002E12FFA3|nr:hypothetical protein OIE66_06020 [Nonomuraea sp. NBC_01738]
MRLSRLQLAGLIACLLTLVTAVATAGVPTPSYTTGFAPHLVTAAAALAGGVFVLLPRLVPLGWAAAVFLLWSAGGLVLDGFRAFFAITGIPAGDFAVVDWPGMAGRALALAATGLVGALVLGRTRVPGGSWLGYTAFALGFIYPMAKLYWSLGGAFLRPAVYDEGFPYGEMAALAIGAIGSLALVQGWGRRLPRRLVLTAGWVGAAMLATMGSMSVFGTLAQLLGVTDGPVPLGDVSAVATVSVVYGSWLLFGLAVAGATLAYQRR